MEITFIHQYSGDSPKRRRLARACETCRARKKRCKHFGEVDKASTQRDESPVASQQSQGGLASDANGVAVRDQPRAAPSGHNRSPVDGRESSGPSEISRPQFATRKRFVSDLNPESTFLNGQGSSGEHNSRSLNGDIGVWVDKRDYDTLVQQRNEATGRGYTFAISQGMHPDQRPHSAVLWPLIDVYFKKFHPILPLLDEAEFRQNHAGGLVPEPLVHAMCLVAAKDPEAEPHLRYSSAPSTLPAREFCGRLHDSVMGALRATCRYDKISLIQILALASLHNEGIDGPEEASMLLSQAMHHAQTLGIHLGEHSNTTNKPELPTKRLFWCLYALDRLNSVMSGRPIIMSDIDIAIEPFTPGESGFPAFEAWLKITQLLNKIIGFYRPHKPVDITGWEDPYPGLEEILDETNAWKESHSCLSTIHLFYLSTAILSHRTWGIKQIPRATFSSVRQRLCAIEVIRLLESEHCRDLHALPLIPYAVSLALSVSYQHLRQSQMYHQQADARTDFRRCTELLQSLRRTWSSADTITALALKVQEGIDKAPSLASFRIPRNVAAATKDQPCPPDINGRRSGILDTVPDERVALRDGADTSETLPGDVAHGDVLQQEGHDLFDGMDDIFGTYLDPNYPMNLDDVSAIEDLPPFDWNQVARQEHHSHVLPNTGNQGVSKAPAFTPQIATPLNALSQEFSDAVRRCPYNK